MKYFKLFIILFKGAMFEYIKEPFFFLGEFVLTLAECFKKLVSSIILLLYVILLFAIYPLRPLQLFYYGIKNRKKWMTEKIYNKYFGGKDDKRNSR